MNIGFYAADTEFLQAAQHFGDSNFMSQAPGGCFYEQGVIVRRDNRAGEGIAAVKTDAEAAAAAVGDELAGVRHEVVGRVLSRDTALDSMAHGLQILLLRQVDFRAMELIAFSNFDLGLHDIDTGNLLGNGMLNLNTRVNLDEVELAVGSSKEFYSAGADIINVLHQLYSCVADSLALLYRQSEGRSDFYELLMTTLYGAVTLEQVHEVAMRIADNLHLDMLRVLQIFFQIDFIIAKSLFRFALGHIICSHCLFSVMDNAHAAAAAAVDSFNNNRIAGFFTKVQHLLHGVYSALGAGNHRNACQLSLLAGVELVAEHNQMLQTRADEGDALLSAAAGQVAVLGQEAVAGVDGVDIMLTCNAQDVFDIKISVGRGFAFADEISFISFVTMQGKGVFLGIYSNGANA